MKFKTERENWGKAREALLELPYVVACACGIDTEGFLVYPVIKTGQEEKAVEIPEIIHETRCIIRFEKDD